MQDYGFNKQKLLDCKSEDEFKLHLPHSKEFILNILQNDDVEIFRKLLHDTKEDWGGCANDILALIFNLDIIPFKVLVCLVHWYNCVTKNDYYEKWCETILYEYLVIYNYRFNELQRKILSSLLYSLRFKSKNQDGDLYDLTYFKDHFSDEDYNKMLKLVLDDSLNNLLPDKNKEKQILLNETEILYHDVYQNWYNEVTRYL